MIAHTTSGRWGLGLLLSLLTVLQWGVLPIVLKGVLAAMDPVTVTWYRFLVAGILLFFYLAATRHLPETGLLKGSVLFTMLAAGLFLCANYISYLMGLDRVTPSVAVVVIQLAPLLFLLGSLVVFRERFTRVQWTGVAMLVTGLGLFFNDRLDLLVSQVTRYTAGVLFVFAAAVFWAVYAMAQKQLLKTFSSEHILLFVYLTGAVVFLPVAHPAGAADLTPVQLGLLLFCAVNTLTAYGCFAEALEHWAASRVSAILALTPLVTVLCMWTGCFLWPGFVVPENLNGISIAGIFLVVAGSMTSSLSRDT